MSRAAANRAVARLVAVVALAGSVACSSAPEAPTRGRLATWASGAVRWLVLDDEWKRIRSMGSPTGALGLIEEFWARRDAQPDVPGNPFREQFYRRVETADLLYPEGGVKGSLTQRGRALILLGPPSRLRVTSRAALSWDPASGARENVTTEHVPVEIWGYQLEDLSSRVGAAVSETGRDLALRLMFVSEPGRTVLAEGEELLELARRAAVHR